MSVEIFLKNIYFFVKILGQACTKDVADWNVDSWQNAFHWAKYCEELYHEVIQRPIKTEFELCLQKLNGLNLPLVCGQLNLKFLKKATSQLTQLLVQNPHLPENLFEKTINIYIKNRESMILFCIEQNRDTSSLETIKKLQTCLDDFRKNEENKKINSFKDFLSEVEAKYLWERIVSSLRLCHDNERFCFGVKKVVQNLNKTEFGWKILLDILWLNHFKRENSSEEIQSKIYSIFENEICSLIKESKNTSFILKIKKRKLCEILRKSFFFFSVCFTQIIQWGNQFIPVYTKTKHNSLSDWISPCEKDLNNKSSSSSPSSSSSYETLMSQLRILINSGPSQKKAVIATLKCLKEEKICCIWSDVLAQI